jgi:hypothetical protein
MDERESRGGNGGWLGAFWQQYQKRMAGEEALRQATEQVVETADPVIRQARGYRKALRIPMAGAIDYCRSLADALPGPVVLSRGNYHADPLVKAIFASPDELEEVIRISPETAKLREQGSRGEVVAMMTMLKQEKTIFGHQREGEIIRRDVAQRAVSFYDHRIVAPSPDLERMREGIVRRGLEVLATVAMEGITTVRSKKAELREKREYLKGILKILGGKSHVMKMFAAPDPEQLEEYRKAERVLAEVEQELEALRDQMATPEHALEHLLGTMRWAGNNLMVQDQSFRLNWMGVRVEDQPESEGHDITLAEFSLRDEFRRSAVLVRFSLEAGVQ